MSAKNVRKAAGVADIDRELERLLRETAEYLKAKKLLTAKKSIHPMRRMPRSAA